MSYREIFESNNNDLQTILDAINELPEAGGGDTSIADAFIARSFTEYYDDRTKIIGNHAFASCSYLTTVEFSVAIRVGSSAFYNCESLKTCIFPAVTSVGYSAFLLCTDLTTLDFSEKISIGSGAFADCSSLTALIIRSTKAVSTIDDGAFIGSSIENGTGYVYVPRALVDSYKGVWETGYRLRECVNQLRALEDYTVDGTITGELDETKI